jgi:spore germination protein GerM
VRRAAVLSVALLALAGACRKKPASLTPNLAVENKVAVRPVTLFFESGDMLLGRARRNLPLPQNPAGALSVVMRELVKSSGVFPRDSEVRATFLLPDGTAFVDLGGPTLTQGWGTGSHEELMAVYSIVSTVTTNFPEVKRVRILVNGEPAETLAGHISLRRALVPMPSLLQ